MQARNHTTTGEGLMSYAAREVVFRMVNGRCPVCQKRMQAPWMSVCRKSSMTIDHLVAWSCGGSNTTGNLIPLCGSCNSSKRDRDVSSWLVKRLGATGATKAKTASGRLYAAARVAAKLEALAADIARELRETT